MIRHYDFADGRGHLTAYQTCGARWWLGLGAGDWCSDSRLSRFIDFRAAFGGWTEKGFESESQAQACAQAFVEAENAISPGHAPEQGD